MIYFEFVYTNEEKCDTYKQVILFHRRVTYPRFYECHPDVR